MNTVRIISRLDIKGPNLVKGVHLEGLRLLGDPKIFAEEYYKDLVDELVYMDVVASLYGRNSLIDFVKYTAEIIFVPLTVGGGVRSLDDINRLLRAGADKIAINTAAIKNPQLIKEASKVFGSQCIVVSIEAKKRAEDKYECLTDNGRETTGLDVFQWARCVEELGAGEILLTSVDNEGTGNGYDIGLTRVVSESVSIPVVACGGCGRPEHARQVVLNGRVNAVAAASIFHYEKLKAIIDKAVSKEYSEGNLDYLKEFYHKGTLGRNTVVPTNIKEFKSYLKGNGIQCRI